MSDINKLLFHAFLLTLMSGSIAGLFAGTALVLRPAWLLYVGKLVNRWISTRKLSSLLERMINIDRWLYRHHRITGILLLAGALFLINFFTGSFDKSTALAKFSRALAIPSAFTDVLLDSAVLSILLGVTFTMIISLFLLIRPSMLKGFERDANQWISLRRSLKPFEIPRTGIDEYVFQNVRMTGIMLLLGSLYTLAVLTAWL